MMNHSKSILTTLRIWLCACAALVTLGTSVAIADGYYAQGSWPIVAAPSEPVDVAYAQDGEVFVADKKGRRIVVYSASSGVFLREFDGSEVFQGELGYPVALALGPEGNLYVADQLKHRVAVFQRSGELVRTLCSYGTGPYGLNGPSDLTFSSTWDLYVADTFNNRVQVYNTSLGHVRAITGAAASLLQGPVGVALYGSGTGEQLYIAELNARRVQVFNTAGTSLRQWGITDGGGIGGETKSRYLLLSGIEVVRNAGAANPSVYVIDSGRSVIESCSPSGSQMTTTPAGVVAEPQGLIPWSAGTFLIADTGHRAVVSANIASGSQATTFAPVGDDALREFNPRHVAASPDGTYYATDSVRRRVYKYNSAGQKLLTFSYTPALSDPAGMAVSRDGQEVYVCDAGSSRLQVYSASGEYLRTLVDAAVFTRPTAVAVRTDGNLIVADAGAKRVQIVDPTTGAPVHTIPCPNSVSLSGLAVTADDTLYVSDAGAHTVSVFGPDLVFVKLLCTQGSAPGQVWDPGGIDVTPAGDVLIADRMNDRIQRVNQAGTSVTVFGLGGSGPGKLMGPTSVAQGTDGRLIIADAGNGRTVTAAHDAIPPTTNPGGDLGVWVNRSAVMTLTASDAGSGIAYSYYRLAGGTPTIYTGPISVTAEGITTISYWSVDRVGNSEEPRSADIQIDRLPPSGSVRFGAGSIEVFRPGAIPVRSDVSGAAEMRVGTAGELGAWIPFAQEATITVGSEGPTQLVAAFRDLAGNVTTSTLACVIDGSGPETNMGKSATGAVGSTGQYGRVFIQALPDFPDGTSMPLSTGRVTITLSASDALSSVNRILYRVDGGLTRQYAGPFAIDSSGAHSVEAWAVDIVGNEGSHVSKRFGISRLPLGGELTVGDGTGFTKVRDVQWSADVQDAVRVNWDAGFGFLAYDVEYTRNLPLSAVFPAPDGRYQMTARFKDSLGTIVDLLEMVELDQTDPIATVTPLPGTWLNTTPVTVSLGAIDASPIKYIKYRLDGGEECTYTVAFVASGDGTHTVEAWATDAAGNVSEVAERTFAISRLPLGGRLVAASGASTVATSTVQVMTDIKSARRMRWNAGDGWSAGSDPSTWPSFTSTWTAALSGEGPKVIEAEFVDDYGQTKRLSTSVTVDLTGPVTDVVFSPGATVTAGPTLVTLAATDAYSPIQSRHYRVNKGTPRVYAPFNMTAEGVYDIEAWSVDRFGNVGDVTLERLTITKLKGPSGVTLAGGAVRYGAADVPVSVTAASATQMCWSTGGPFSDWGPFTASFKARFASEGEQVLVVKLKDRFGTEIELSDTITIDLSAPVTEFVGMPPEGKSNAHAFLAFTSTDLSPVTYTYYALDGGVWRAYTAPVTVYEAGVHIVRYYSKDIFGRVESVRTSTFTIVSELATETIVLDPKRSFVNTTTVTAVLHVPDAASVRFDAGAGYSGPLAYETTHTIVLPDRDGLHWIKASVLSSEGVETRLNIPVIVDRAKPTVSSLAVSLRSFKIVSGVFRYGVYLTAKGSDSHPFSSSIREWKWTVGPYVAKTVGSASAYGPKAGINAVSLLLKDGAGNVGAQSGRLRLGAAAAPSVPSAVYANRYFTVRGRVTVPGSGSSYRLQCFQRSANGTWYLKKNLVIRPTVSGSVAIASNRIYLSRGTWRVVLVATKGAYVNAGVPSAAIAVR